MYSLKITIFSASFTYFFSDWMNNKKVDHALLRSFYKSNNVLKNNILLYL